MEKFKRTTKFNPNFWRTISKTRKNRPAVNTRYVGAGLGGNATKPKDYAREERVGREAGDIYT